MQTITDTMQEHHLQTANTNYNFRYVIRATVTGLLMYLTDKPWV
jgi:hypothetical protein